MKDKIKWISYKELVITPEMENWDMLLYTSQTKLCALKVPKVITASIIDGKVEICYSHHLKEEDFGLCEITHYVWLNDPWDCDYEELST